MSKTIESILILILIAGLAKTTYPKYVDVQDDIPVKVNNIYDNNDYKINNVDKYYKKPRSKPKKVFKHPGSLGLSKNDIRLVRGKDGDYLDLIIRKKKNIKSILLTNYFWKENGKKVSEYGLRATRYNHINGNEKRLFKGRLIGKKQGLHFLLSSTPVNDYYLGTSFRIRIPKYVVYGYRNSKIYGIVKIRDGVKINIRTFNRKYADYAGFFKDNPILIILNQKPITIKDHPTIVKLKEVQSDGYIGVKVKFQSKRQLFKSFLVKEENEKNYKEIEFSSSGFKMHKKAILVEAVYEGKQGVYLIAVIYFKRKKNARSYYVIAIDKSGAHTKGEHIKIVVPMVPNKTIKPSQNSDSIDKEEKQHWYKDFD